MQQTRLRNLNLVNINYFCEYQQSTAIFEIFKRIYMSLYSYNIQTHLEIIYKYQSINIYRPAW